MYTNGKCIFHFHQPKQLIKIRNRIIKQNRTVIHVQIIIEISIIISTQRFFLTPYKFFNTNVDDFKSLYQFSIPMSPMVYQPNRFNTDGLIDGMAVNTFQYRRSSARKALLETVVM